MGTKYQIQVSEVSLFEDEISAISFATREEAEDFIKLSFREWSHEDIEEELANIKEVVCE